MTRKEARAILENDLTGHIEGNDKFMDAFWMAVDALKQEPCEDAISRDAVDKYIARLLSGYLYDGERERLEIFSAYLWELPSVTPSRRKGHWIEEEMYDQDICYRCSECDEVFCLIEGTPELNEYHYCPNCGAEMESEE